MAAGHRISARFDWTPKALADLEADWRAGLSMSQMAEKRGVTKNVVSGMAHRQKFPPRRSPIRPPSDAPKQRRRAGKVTLPPVDIGNPISLPVPQMEAAEGIDTADTLDTADAIASLPPFSPRPVVFRSMSDCCWPIGDPGSRSFRFCTGTAEPGRQYCLEHCKVAFPRLRQMAEATT